jgi:putative DNA primase/helicase
VDNAEVMRRAKDTIGAIYGEAMRERDEGRRQALAKWAGISESVAHLRAMVELACTEDGVYIDVVALDADPWLLGVENGVVDLRTGKLRSAQRDDLITKCARAAFDRRARCPVFEKYVQRIMGGDAHLIAFLRRAVGYSLTGETSAKGLFFLYGPTGDNGKTTLLELLQTLLGDYSRKVSAEMLMSKRFASAGSARPDLVALVGRRLVVASELSDAQRFDEAFLKDMVGGQDRIEARDLYKGTINFKPVFKLWLYGNHKPQIRSDDDAAWRRLYLVPFNVSIPKAEQDRDLLAKLLAESSGILNWALSGLADYRRAGLRPPVKVVAATADYREEQDWFARFIDEQCVRERSANMLRLKDLFLRQVQWCKDANVRPLSEPRFRDQLKSKGFSWKAGAQNVRYVLGLRAKTVEHDFKPGDGRGAKC